MKPLSYYLSEPIDLVFLYYINQANFDDKKTLITALGMILHCNENELAINMLPGVFNQSLFAEFIEQSNAYDILQLLAAIAMCLLDEMDERTY